MNKKTLDRTAEEMNFCRFHRGLADIGLVSCGTDCVIKNTSHEPLSFPGPENVTFEAGGNLGQLIRIIGRERWVAIRDDPAGIKAIYDRLQITGEMPDSLDSLVIEGCIDLGDGEEISI